MTKIVETDLPVLVGELIKRMDEKEKLALANRFSWEELEEWKATAETMADRSLMRKIRKGLADEKRGKIKPIYPH
jgi:hypothetical protein